MSTNPAPTVRERCQPLLSTLAVLLVWGSSGCLFDGRFSRARPLYPPDVRISPPTVAGPWSPPAAPVLVTVAVPDHPQQGPALRAWGETLQQHLVKEVGLRGFSTTPLAATGREEGLVQTGRRTTVPQDPPSGIQQVSGSLEAPPLMPGLMPGLEPLPRLPGPEPRPLNPTGPPTLYDSPRDPFRYDSPGPSFVEGAAAGLPGTTELHVEVLEFSPYTPLTATLRITLIDTSTGTPQHSRVISWKPPAVSALPQTSLRWRSPPPPPEHPAISPRLLAERLARDVADWHHRTTQASLHVLYE